MRFVSRRQNGQSWWSINGLFSKPKVLSATLSNKGLEGRDILAEPATAAL
jgi:hypothetical protein